MRIFLSDVMFDQDKTDKGTTSIPFGKNDCTVFRKVMSTEDMIHIPVLFGERGTVEKDFRADGYHPNGQIVLEVEAGRAVANNQFLKNLFEACMMENSRHLCIAVRKIYTDSGVNSQDYDHACTFFRTL